MYNLKEIDLKSITNKSVGNKAANLQRLSLAGIRIPRGYVLTNEFLMHLLKENGEYERFVELCNEQYVINRCRKIKKIIDKLVFQESEVNALEEILKELGGKMIVRSSSDNEDSPECSMAGMYLSIGGIEDADALKKAILECFASAYSQAILITKGSFDDSMALILQEYVPADYAGIAFTIDPVDGNNDVMRINYDDDVSLLADGEATGHTVLLKRQGNGIEVKEQYKEGIAELYSKLLTIEEVLGYASDVEWAHNSDGITILQARPITGMREPEEDKDVLDLDDISSMEGIMPGRLSVSHDKWFSKKYYVRKACISGGIPVYAARYVYLSDDENSAFMCIK